MNYEVGKYYRTRDGSKAKCIHRLVTGSLVFVIDPQDMGWNVYVTRSDGRARRDGCNHGDDILGPWIDKPVVDWDKMPAWARYVMQDRDGTWFWFNDALPKDMSEMWSGCTVYTSGMIPPEHAPTWTGDWKDSLVERPKV